MHVSLAICERKSTFSWQKKLKKSLLVPVRLFYTVRVRLFDVLANVTTVASITIVTYVTVSRDLSVSQIRNRRNWKACRRK